MTHKEILNKIDIFKRIQNIFAGLLALDIIGFLACLLLTDTFNIPIIAFAILNLLIVMYFSQKVSQLIMLGLYKTEHDFYESFLKK